MSVVQEIFNPSHRKRADRPKSTVGTGGERFAKLQLARSTNVGPRSYAQLLRRFGSARAALEALPALAARGGKPDYVACDADVISVEIEAGEKIGARLTIVGDPDYPAMLGTIEPAPPILWILGEKDLFRRRSVAIVGARNASALGQRTARRLARELGSSGYVVVSGLARGVDAAAHESSLSTGTIAVMAGGLDQPYPAENTELAERIAEGGALGERHQPGRPRRSHHHFDGRSQGPRRFDLRALRW
ncbi:MAG: DNA-processing protein DprA, partial [Pseudomonadota bacterium]